MLSQDELAHEQAPVGVARPTLSQRRLLRVERLAEQLVRAVQQQPGLTVSQARILTRCDGRTWPFVLDVAQRRGLIVRWVDGRTCELHVKEVDDA
jgi:hypothetical protein